MPKKTFGGAFHTEKGIPSPAKAAESCYANKCLHFQKRLVVMSVDDILSVFWMCLRRLAIDL